MHPGLINQSARVSLFIANGLLFLANPVRFSEKKTVLCTHAAIWKKQTWLPCSKMFPFFQKHSSSETNVSEKKKMTRNSNSVTMLPRLRNQNKQNNKMFINFFYLQIFQILVRFDFLFMYSLDFSMSQIPADRKRYVHAHKFNA